MASRPSKASQYNIASATATRPNNNDRVRSEQNAPHDNVHRGTRNMQGKRETYMYRPTPRRSHRDDHAFHDLVVPRCEEEDGRRRPPDTEHACYDSSHAARHRSPDMYADREINAMMEQIERHIEPLTEHRIKSLQRMPRNLEFVNSIDDEDDCYDRKVSAVEYDLKDYDLPYMVESEGSSSNHSTWEDDSSRSSQRYGRGTLYRTPSDNSFHCSRTPPPYTKKYEYPNRDRTPPRNASPEPVEKLTPHKTIEIEPGHYVRLRGADETWRAIACDFYMPCECICCEITIFCIQDAKYVLCPDCRVVSLLGGDSDDYPVKGGGDGVGLGFKMEDLATWQEEITRDRNYR